MDTFSVNELIFQYRSTDFFLPLLMQIWLENCQIWLVGVFIQKFLAWLMLN